MTQESLEEIRKKFRQRKVVTNENESKGVVAAKKSLLGKVH
jgi:hypothetical protein